MAQMIELFLKFFKTFSLFLFVCCMCSVRVPAFCFVFVCPILTYVYKQQNRSASKVFYKTGAIRLTVEAVRGKHFQRKSIIYKQSFSSFNRRSENLHCYARMHVCENLEFLRIFCKTDIRVFACIFVFYISTQVGKIHDWLYAFLHV